MKPNWFIAIPVDAGRWLRPLLRTAPDSLRLFHPADIHITVAFLGACGEQLARRAWSHVHGVSAAPLTVTLGGLEPMGNPRRPSALSVVIASGAEPVIDLIGSLRGPAWQAAEARPDDRPVLPHITVARPPRRASSQQRRAAVDWAERHAPVEAQVVLDRLTLMTWARDRQLRQFRVVEEHRLSPSPAGSDGSPPPGGE